MRAGFAFKTTDPEVLGIIGIADAALKAYYDSTAKLQAALPDGCHVLEWRWARSRRVTGIRADRYQQGMPDGWRYYVKERRWEPDRRGGDYKAIAAGLPKVHEPEYPGVPNAEVFIERGGQSFLLALCPRVINGAAWIASSGEIRDGDTPTAPWEAARYSDYIRACEDAEVQP